VELHLRRLRNSFWTAVNAAGIDDLKTALAGHLRLQAGVAGMDEDEAVARVGEIRERLERRDPAAFAGDCTGWSGVFDQLESGQM
jgi:hypothetical protein